MAIINHKIGMLNKAIENANRVPSLIDRNPIPFPKDYYSQESKYLLKTDQDADKVNGFVCGAGMDKVGGTRVVIG